jgi:signal transduction histidine kinase
MVLLPLLAFGAFLVLRSANHEEEMLARILRDRTRSTARDVERELAKLRGKLFVIANTQSLQFGNFAALYDRATTTFGSVGLMFVLSEPDGAEVLNTYRPLGMALPEIGDRQAVQQVADRAAPYVSNMTASAVTGKPVVMMHVPVMQDGKVAYVASVDVLPALARLMGRQDLPQEWIGGLIDRQGNTISRSRDPDKYVGKAVRTEVLQRLLNLDEGWFPFTSREGIPLYVAFSRVKPVGWTVAVGIPLDVLYAPVRRSRKVLITAGTSAVALALLLATLIGRRVAQPIKALVVYAEALGRSEFIERPRTHLHESNIVARALHRASEDLRQSREEREAVLVNLIRVNEERRQLLSRTVAAQEVERARLARELHDSLAQYLTALQLGLSEVRQRCAAADAGMPYLLARLHGLMAEIGREVNRIAWELRPTTLDDLGLERAVTQYLEEWQERSRLRFDVRVCLPASRLPEAVEITLYRALQETVTNVIRHADAERVSVILEAAGGHVLLIVEDDGKGFVPEETAHSGRRLRHFGLLGVQERLAMAGGTLEVDSVPGAGTTLFMRLPI